MPLAPPSFPAAIPSDTLFGNRFAGIAEKTRKLEKVREFSGELVRTLRNDASKVSKPGRRRSDLIVVVVISIEELIDLVLFNRSLGRRLVDVGDLHSHWAGLRGL